MNKAIIIPNLTELHELTALHSSSVEELASKVADQMVAFENQSFELNGRRISVNTVSKLFPLAYFLNDLDQEVIVLIGESTEASNGYSLATINAVTGNHMFGGEDGLHIHHKRNHELKEIFGLMVGFQKKLDLTDLTKQGDGFEKILLNSNNGRVEFWGKEIQKTDESIVYEVLVSGATRTIVKDLKNNLTHLNLI